MAYGHSGRLNSGVVMARQSDRSLAFFRAIIADCEGAVPSEDIAPYENGHVIKHGKADPVVGIIERRWNNTADPELDDPIRYFMGPMAIRIGGDRKARTRRYRRLGTLRNSVLGLWTGTLPVLRVDVTVH